MLVFLPSLGCFYIPEILGGAKSMLIGNFIKNQFLVARDWPLGAAASTIMTALLVLMIIGYWLSSRRVALRERKGADTGAGTAGRTPDGAHDMQDGGDGMARGARGRA